MQLQNALTRCSFRATKEAPCALERQHQQLCAISAEAAADLAASLHDASCVDGAAAKMPPTTPTPRTAPLSAADDILVDTVEPLLWHLQQQQLALVQQAEAAAATADKLQKQCFRSSNKSSTEGDVDASAQPTCVARLCVTAVSLLQRDTAFKLQLLQEVAAAAATAAETQGSEAAAAAAVAKAARLAWLTHPFIASLKQQLPLLRRRCLQEQQRQQQQTASEGTRPQRKQQQQHST
ncbi:uncharacterized protein LOC113147411 [Cyclospora cayetanensis]|uniref:Uncharacterized protein LOC113147411 n=1 Tax=Cyclospora cayetanensis TaxID=88456 RepID=A0A6P6S1Y6_9EIME|nr:uncharacterized protein LOC113147411 [Cyclospora cayetanensis]